MRPITHAEIERANAIAARRRALDANSLRPITHAEIERANSIAARRTLDASSEVGTGRRISPEEGRRLARAAYDRAHRGVETRVVHELSTVARGSTETRRHWPTHEQIAAAMSLAQIARGR